MGYSRPAGGDNLAADDDSGSQCPFEQESTPAVTFTPLPPLPQPQVPINLASLPLDAVKEWMQTSAVQVRDPWRTALTLTAAAEALPASDTNPVVRAEVLQALADALVGCFRGADAAAVQRDALQALQDSGVPENSPLTVVGRAQLAKALQIDGKLHDALGVLRAALELPKLPAVAQAVLLRMESEVYGCVGDDITALQRFEDALSLDPGTP